MLGRLNCNIEKYKESLEKVGHAAAVQAAACDRTRGARNELTTMRSSLEARRAEEVELGQAVEQVNVDMAAAKQAHDGQVAEFEKRRQQAVVQHQELQGKRTEEQKQWSVLQAQRAELEAEIANIRRAHEAEMNDFHSHLRTIQDEGEAYVQTVEGLMVQCDGEGGRKSPHAGCRTMDMKSPGSARKKSPSLRASPAPRRLMMNSGY